MIHMELRDNAKKNLLRKGFFQLAYNISRHSDMWPAVGAVIVKKKPVSVGYNSLKTHRHFSIPFYSDYLPRRIHAETQAIINVRFITNLDGATMYVYRETDDGWPAIARPCDQCMWLLKQYGFKDVFYTINDYPFWKREKIK